MLLVVAIWRLGAGAVVVGLEVSGAGIVIGENLGLGEDRCRRRTMLKKDI